MSTSGKEPEAPTSIPPESVALLDNSESTVTSEKSSLKTKKSHDGNGESSDDVIEGKNDPTTTELFEEEGLGAVSEFMNAKWDPDSLNDGDQATTPSHACIRRIKNDIMAIYADPPPGLCVVPDPNNIRRVHALITGPFDTPYEGGFFYFLIRFPTDYPINPPRVRLMTTGGGTVRFNPNLYKNGKVCLSILGTWAGPSWSPAQTLSTVLISIQSLMNEKPYHNEPGFKHERTSGDAKHYNDIIQHETIRVAVCDMVDGVYSIPDSLRAFMESLFPDYYHYYLQVCESHMHLDGMPMNDPFGDARPNFTFKSLIERLKTIYLRIDSNIGSGESDKEEDDGEGANRQVISSS